jgi:hypothetical protein
MTTESLPALPADAPIDVTPAAAPDATPAAAPWPYAKRAALYTAFVFFFFVNGLYPLQFIPGLAQFSDPLAKFWTWIVPLAGKSLFGVATSELPNGSGDTTWNYVQAFLWVVLALAAGLGAAALDRKGSRASRAHEAFRIYARYAMTATMFGYGFSKVIQLQFPTPTLERLVEPYGASSPMGVLWTFMGASRAYNFITGAAEVTAGLLMTTRRTTLAGALLSMVVMGNIMILNFCYDVPVKLYSTELFLMAVALALPDMRRLLAFFLRRNESNGRPLFRRPSLETVSLVLRTLLITGLFLWSLKDANDSRKAYGDLAPKSPLRGIWNVDQLTDNGIARPPLTTDESRWRRVVFDRPGYVSFQLMSDWRERYTLALDEKAHTGKLVNRDVLTEKGALTYARPDANTLVLDVLMSGHQLHAVCRKGAKPPDLLLTRGFHWVNERPFNK